MRMQLLPLLSLPMLLLRMPSWMWMLLPALPRVLLYVPMCENFSRCRPENF